MLAAGSLRAGEYERSYYTWVLAARSCGRIWRGRTSITNCRRAGALAGTWSGQSPSGLTIGKELELLWVVLIVFECGGARTRYVLWMGPMVAAGATSEMLARARPAHGPEFAELHHPESRIHIYALECGMKQF